MSQIQTEPPTATLRVSEKDLPKLFSVQAQKQQDAEKYSFQQESKSTLDRILSPTRGPRKFDNKGKRSAAWDSKLQDMTVSLPMS